MALKGNIDIFQITDKQFKPKGIEFTLHKPIRYSQSIQDRIYLANKPPFGSYQVGDFLGINTDLVHWYSFAESYVWDDKDAVSKVVAKPPQFYTKQVFKSEEFGDGWVEESE